jgi:lipopolysaccharide transport system ATP-binding protein
VGIIGRNGAGKSTLLKILSRITEPTRGRLVIRGRVASLLEVGTGFHPELTGRENIFLNGAVLGMKRSEIRKKFDAIVDFAEVEQFLDTPVKRFSSGMYVRLAFAVAAHLEPEILVVDEVLAVGDAQFQKKCLGKMEDVSKKEGRTVLFVSHNIGIISQLCNSAIWLNKGNLKKMGVTEEVVKQYVQFLGSSTNTTFKRESQSVNTITSAELYSGGTTSSSFLFKDQIDIQFNLQLGENSDYLNVGVAVLNNLKQKIFTSHFDVSATLGKHSKVCSVRCSIPPSTLVPGWYSLDIAIFRSGSNVYDYLKDICPFEVVDSGFELSGYADFGFVNIPCKWTVGS